MSYGVIASKTAQVLVETGGHTEGGEPSPRHGLDHFTTLYGAKWVGGRVTLTSRHLTFVPHAPSLDSKPGERMLELDVTQVDEVGVTGGLVGGRILTVRAGGRTMRLKCRGAAQLADQIRAVSRRSVGGRRTA